MSVTLSAAQFAELQTKGAAAQTAGDSVAAYINSLAPSGPVPDFFDDFTTLSIGSPGSTWQYCSWFAPNNQGYGVNQGWMVNPSNPATPIGGNLYSVANSILSLGFEVTPAAYAAACGNCEFLASQIVSTQTFMHGYFEANIRAPKYAGTNYAFWSIAPGAPWPPEIDGVEIVMQTAAQSGSYFAAQTLHVTSSQQDQALNADHDATQFTTYGWDWEAGTVTMYLNRVATGTWPTPSIYTYPMNIIFSAQVGGGWAGNVGTSPVPGPMQVDSIAWYKGGFPFG